MKFVVQFIVLFYKANQMILMPRFVKLTSQKNLIPQ